MPKVARRVTRHRSNRTPVQFTQDLCSPAALALIAQQIRISRILSKLPPMSDPNLMLCAYGLVELAEKFMEQQR